MTRPAGTSDDIDGVNAILDELKRLVDWCEAESDDHASHARQAWKSGENQESMYASGRSEALDHVAGRLQSVIDHYAEMQST